MDSAVEGAAAPTPALGLVGDTSTMSEGAHIEGASPKSFRARIAQCKTKKRSLIPDWNTNIDYRRGKENDLDTDDNRIPLPIDWAYTKAKGAKLFSQVPQVVADGHGPYKPAAPVVQAQLNRRLAEAKVGVAMREVIVDIINAAGFGGVFVSYEAMTEDRPVPVQPLDTLSMADRTMIKLGLMQQEMQMQPIVVDRRFTCTRISPADLLWPTDFRRADFDEASWLGYSGQCTWAEALQRFPTLTEDDKRKVSGDNRNALDRLGSYSNTGENTPLDDDIVLFDEIFYWDYRYNPNQKYFKAIHRLVFVEGKEEPVIDEPWKGQEFDKELGTYIGACRFPVRIGTLDYISDEAIPPSNSAIGRPTVKAMIKSRTHQEEQRDHSKPIRWYDVNRVDPDIQTALMNGEFQGFIPTQGAGEKAIGEVARSNYPRDSMEADHTFKADLSELVWGMGANQMGSLASGERSAAEAKITQGNSSTLIGQERALMVEFFLGIADVMMGLMALYDDFVLPDPQDGQRLQMWDRRRINHKLAFSIRGDTTVLLTADERIERLVRLLDVAGKSGYMDVEPIIGELVSLTGLDPGKLVRAPAPKGPEPPNISFRFSGAQDLVSPLAVAILMKAGQAPSPQEIQAAIALIESAGAVTTLTLGSKEDVAETSMHVKGEPTQTPGGPPGAGPGPMPMNDSNPNWTQPARINERRDQNAGA